jgi:hypothetical protein
MSARPLTFWHVAGDVIYRADGRPMAISEDMALSLRATYRDECRAAYNARDFAEAAKTARLWCELGSALDALDMWRRVIGGPPVNFAGAVEVGS